MNPNFKKKATPEEVKRCEDAKNDMMEALRPHADAIGQAGLLAVTAYTVGMLVALQDSTKVTPDMALDLVNSNIEAGNKEVLSNLLKVGGQPN